MKILILTPLFFLAALLARAESTDLAKLVADAERGIERGMLRASAADIEAAVKPIDAAFATDPKNPALMYTRAFAHYAMMAPLHSSKDQEPVDRELTKALSLLEHVKGQPWEAEAAGLASNICGQLISIRGGMAGMQLGPKAGMLMSRAEKALPGNARVLFYRGTSLFNTPPQFGGDPDVGAKLMQQAVDAFAKRDAGAAGPHWGQASALTWLGIAKQKAGDHAAARAAWEKALQLEPDYGWVKFALLPSLDQKATK